MIEFTPEQRAYIDSDINSHVFLEACPGSGKTEVVAAKVAVEAENWGGFPGGIAVLSFANSATDELKSRVSKHFPAGRSLFPHFIGTFDSFIYKNIVSPLVEQLTGHQAVEGDCTLHIVEAASRLGFRTKYSYSRRGSVYANHFSINMEDDDFIFSTGDSIHDRELNSMTLEGWRVKDLTDTKERMWSAGYATYKDIEFLAERAFSLDVLVSYVERLALRFPLIIVDECQDLSFEQLLILRNLSDLGVKLHFIGDLHQAIYGFRYVDPEAVKQFTDDYQFKKLALTKNFRSCQKIINLCGKLTGRENIVGQLSQMDPTCYLAQYNSCPTELVAVLEELCTGFNDVVFVARGHAMIQRFEASTLRLTPTHKLAFAVKTFNYNDSQLLERSLNLYSEFLQHHLQEAVKPNSYNCPQSIDSNLSWRRFLGACLSELSSSGLQNMDVDWSTWVRSAKSLMRSLNTKLHVNDQIKTVIQPLSGVNFRAPSGKATAIVNLCFGDVINSTNLVHKKATIHSVKGETHEVTVLISTPTAGGASESHWKNWLGDPTSEAARFAYVASSRPKNRLIWVVKKLNKADARRFEALGFHLV